MSWPFRRKDSTAPDMGQRPQVDIPGENAIMAGTVWTHDRTGDTLEFVQDIRVNSPLVASAFILNGKPMDVGGIFPEWCLWPATYIGGGLLPTFAIGQFRITPPEGVIVT